MKNELLIKALRECEYCNVCSIAVDGDCPFGGRNALEVAAADALEAADKRIAELMPKEGEWIPVDDGMVYVKCSVCGDVMCCRGHYCTNCGAKMKKGEEK